MSTLPRLDDDDVDVGRGGAADGCDDLACVAPGGRVGDQQDDLLGRAILSSRRRHLRSRSVVSGTEDGVDDLVGEPGSGGSEHEAENAADEIPHHGWWSSYRQ
jgi:hypothetical protein